MLSFGAVALDDEGTELGSFTRNLHTLEGAKADPDTAIWWSTQHDAWEKCRVDCVPPERAIPDYVRWVKDLPGRPVLVGYPIVYDGMFNHWYIERFFGKDPFSFSGIDIKTYAMAVLGGEYRESTKKAWPKKWFPKNMPHTHVALDDAREQGQLFINILKAGRKLREEAEHGRSYGA
jgi:hypothetical protein